jgi:OFA family oxalate/formate antiporter-like MFS transporter
MNRWFRLAAAVIAMIMIGNLQYAWTMAVQPIMSATGWKLSQVLIDRLGPRRFMTMAGFLCAIGWCGIGYARSLPEFYTLYSIAGLGNSFVYCCSTAFGLKWFPDKRGVASGLIAAGYGSGAALFNPFFGHLIQSDGYRDTFLFTGVALGAVILIAGQFLKYPPDGFIPVPPTVKPQLRRQTEQFTSREMLGTPQFYVLYAMMLAVGIGGLMATAQVAPVGRNFGVGALAMTVALSLNPLGNGIARIGWGWASDGLGRERTMALAFGLQALFLASVVTVGRMGDTWFVVTMALVFLTWGELYVLFPTVLADMFGARYAASNYAFLYSTKGVASILAGGLAAKLFESAGSWNYAFYASAGLALLSSIAALGLLRMPLPTKRAALESPNTTVSASAPSR